jgi:hypothetical protein
MSVATNHETDYLHLVFEGRIEALITRLLRRAPRTLCGESLWGDPEQPQPTPCSPYCPACVEVSGNTEEEIAALTEFVPGYWV